MIRIHFGQQLTLALKNAGRSQKWLAYTLDTNHQTVNKWTKRPDSSLSTICRICEALDISVAEFIAVGEGNG